MGGRQEGWHVQDLQTGQFVFLTVNMQAIIHNGGSHACVCAVTITTCATHMYRKHLSVPLIGPKFTRQSLLIALFILQRCVQCNNNAPNCETIGSDGPGVNNTDYILYVGTDPGGSCTSQGVLAFANICQMEATLDR